MSERTIAPARRAGLSLVICALFLAVNLPPALAAVTANPDVAVAGEDTPVDIPVMANDFSDGSPPVITATTPPTNGTVAIVGSVIRYTPLPDYNGPDSFTYDISADSFTDTATVFITVNPANDPPTVAADIAAVGEDSSVSIAVLGNDSDPEGDPLTLASVGVPSFGTAIISGNNVVYTPMPDYSGPDLFTYTVTDGKGGVGNGTVSVTVNPTNDPPIANPDVAGTFRDTPVVIAVTANDTDADGDTLTVVAVGTASNGTVAITGPGDVTYTPNAGYAGPDSFTYTIDDGSPSTSSAPVTISVSATNRNPIASNDVTSTPASTPVTLDVLANDTDPDGDPLTITTVGSPAQGSAILNPDDTITYSPTAGFAGVDAFVYNISDGLGGTALAVATIHVAAAPGALVALADTALVDEDAQVVVDVLANDLADLAIATDSITNPAHGVTTLLPDGTVRYTPAADYFGPDSFTYLAKDLAGNTASALVTLNVFPVNDAPIAEDDFARTTTAVPVELAVLANDSDIDNADEELTARLAFPPSEGSATFSASGSVTYTSNPGFVGTDSFTYETCDGDTCTVAQVIIEVTAALNLPGIDPVTGLPLPQLTGDLPAPPLASRPALTPSIGISLASRASLESLRTLLLPLAMLGVTMVWFLTGSQFPFLFFWRRKKNEEEAEKQRQLFEKLG